MANKDSSLTTQELFPQSSAPSSGRTRNGYQPAREIKYSSLSDVELLKKLIGAHELHKRYDGRLEPLFAPGGTNSQMPERCAVAKELVIRWLAETITRHGVLSQPQAVKDYLRIHFAGREYESFVVLFLDAQNRLIQADEMFKGTLTQTSVYPREIVKLALRHNAAAVIFSHNHPSGAASPSSADRTLTRALTDALALVDVRVLDHLIVAGPNTSSFAEQGLL